MMLFCVLQCFFLFGCVEVEEQMPTSNSCYVKKMFYSYLMLDKKWKEMFIIIFFLFLS